MNEIIQKMNRLTIDSREVVFRERGMKCGKSKKDRKSTHKLKYFNFPLDF